MAVGMETQEFKSPARKLIRFFQRSRDKWKQKHHEVKRTCKKLGNQVAAVEKSRRAWRTRAKQLDARVRELEAALEREKNLTG
jgi:hypothetical protein